MTYAMVTDLEHAPQWVRSFADSMTPIATFEEGFIRVYAITLEDVQSISDMLLPEDAGWDHICVDDGDA